MDKAEIEKIHNTPLNLRRGTLLGAVLLGTYEEFLKFYGGDPNFCFGKEFHYYSLLCAVMQSFDIVPTISRDDREDELIKEHLREEKMQITRFLLKEGADVNFVERKHKMNIIQMFYFSQCQAHNPIRGETVLEMTKLLVEHGADLNWQNKYGITSMIRLFLITNISEKTRIVILDYLLRHGARWDIKDYGGMSYLDLCYESHAHAPETGAYLKDIAVIKAYAKKIGEPIESYQGEETNENMG